MCVRRCLRPALHHARRALRALAGELEASVVPFWAWNGEYLKQPPRPMVAKPEDVNAKDFCPWQYPDIHAASVPGPTGS